MIKQQFLLNGKEFLRIYHDGFQDYPQGREISQTETLAEGNIEFHELWIANLTGESISYDNVTSGFLPLDHSKNPYGTLCCHFKEFIRYEKSVIKGGKIENPVHFRKVRDFVKKWAGFDLNKAPYSMNNVLLFEPTRIQLDKKIDAQNERILKLSIMENGYGELTGVIKFKRHDSIVDTRIVSIVESTVLIESVVDWTSVDIELFEEGQLVYAYYDLSFIKSINIDMGIVTKQVKVDLQQSGETVTLEEVSSQPIIVGETTDPKELTAYQYQEQLLKRQLNATKRFEFLSKGEYERGLEIFGEIAQERGYRELWVFDPYFLSYESGGKRRLNDILTILGKNLTLKKKIVFEARQDDVQTKFTEFKAALQTTVEDLRRKRAILDFKFIGTKEHFHDRFIFLKNEHKLRAFMLGTSFNSFGENYSTIIELEELDGRHVFDSLMNDIVKPDNLVLTEAL
jgi:hypothetical protein